MNLKFEIDKKDLKPIVVISGFLDKIEAEQYMVSLEMGNLIGEVSLKDTKTKLKVSKFIKTILGGK